MQPLKIGVKKHFEIFSALRLCTSLPPQLPPTVTQPLKHSPTKKQQQPLFPHHQHRTVLLLLDAKLRKNSWRGYSPLERGAECHDWVVSPDSIRRKIHIWKSEADMRPPDARNARLLLKRSREVTQNRTGSESIIRTVMLCYVDD